MDTPDWAKEALPEELHSIPFLQDTTDLAGFVNTLTHASQYMGNSIRIPSENAGDEDLAAFHEKLQSRVPNLMQVDVSTPEGQTALFKKLGLPEDAAGYGAGDDFKWLAEVAQKSNMTKTQFESLVSNLGETNTARTAESKAAQAQAISDLHTEWGLAKPKNMENIKGLAKLTGAPESLLKSIEDGTADVSTIKWMSDLAGKFEQSANFHVDANNPEGHVTPAEAAIQIQEIVDNPEYWKQGSAIGAGLRKKMLELQAMKAPQANSNLDDLRANAQGINNMLNNFG